MTKEEFNILTKYDKHFNTAIKSNYTRSIPTNELQKLVDIYSRIIKNNFKLCYHCNSSILEFMKRLGNIYLKEKNKRLNKTENGKTRKSE